jgi:hypothetical protein
MDFCHMLNLSKGKETVRCLVSSVQPNTVEDSDKVPSSVSFDRDKQSSLIKGSFGDTGLQMV